MEEKVRNNDLKFNLTVEDIILIIQYLKDYSLTHCDNVDYDIINELIDKLKSITL